ncbi:pre-mRNA-splicing factor ATP-dependent RNA helicase DEAH1 [Trifolium repens]|nr:pre-mRNA-splicing factor ATP-dependent RNA helicase DEAH1 [Trifolium repens]
MLQRRISLIKASMMDGDKFDYEKQNALEKSRAKSSVLEALQEERNYLIFIYPFRDEFLQAVHDHRVLVIVGETSSGKTTRYPVEINFTKAPKPTTWMLLL